MTKLINCFFTSQGTSALFFGANVALPQAKELSSCVNRASTEIGSFASGLCKVIQTTVKFDSDEFKKAGQALTDMEYLFADMQGFYNSYLNCLNNQSESQTALASVNNIQNLIYQLEVYILTGIDLKLGGASDALGAVFGENVKTVIQTIASQYTDEFSTVRESLETLTENFMTIIESGSEITAETIASDLNATALNDMITAFKDITVTSSQMSVIIVGFVKITATLDTVTTSVDIVEGNSTAMITKANYELDISIQASRKIFTKNVLTYQGEIDDSFAEFYALSSMLFTGDADIQEARGKVDVFVSAINGVFESISEKFVAIFTENLSAMQSQIQTMKDSMTESTNMVTDYLSEAVAMNSASFVKCFGPSTNNSVIALQLVQTLGMNSSACITAQQNVSLQAQSLMTFIIEDVVLNVRGAADKLCGCSVKGGKKDNDITKKCIKKVRKNIFD